MSTASILASSRASAVRILDVPPVREDGLPPMDVPVFVGFAERGPLHAPVAVEDMTQYRALFGGVVPLPPGPGENRPRRAHLSAAVASFFAAGGRRCHVVRVAGQTDTATFPLPGLRRVLRCCDGIGQPARWRDDGAVTLRAASPGGWAADLRLALRRSGRALRSSDRVRRGELLHLWHPDRPDEHAWCPVEADGDLASALAAARAATAWHWTPAGIAPDSVVPTDWLADAITVDLRLRADSQPERRRDRCALTSAAFSGSNPGDPWFTPDLATRHAAGDTDLRGFDPTWPLAGMPEPTDPSVTGWMIIPDTLVEPGFGAEWPAVFSHANSDALTRDGLDRLEAVDFLDPALADRPRGRLLRERVDAMRFLTDRPRRLMGLHAALGRDDTVAREATWIAVPDAVHAGWDTVAAPLPRDGTLAVVDDPPCTCPDAPAFGPCERPPRVPQAPRLQVPTPQPAGVPFVIRATPPAGTPAPLDVELQISRDGDPDSPRTLPWAPLVTPTTWPITLAAGRHTLRARVRRAGQISAWSAPVDVMVTGPTRVTRGEVDPARVLLPVHEALTDLCAMTREHIALASMPAAWDAAALGRHADALREHVARDPEAGHAGSFVVLHHPWLTLRDDDKTLQDHPPDGALLGLWCRRSRQRGAWAVVGREPLAAVQDLATSVDPAAVAATGANPIERLPTGLVADQALTLDGDPDWQALDVRRLMILLRRIARREGEQLAFEPNGPTLRRSLAARLDAALQRLMQRGAFRGRSTPECYALRTADGAAVDSEMAGGLCSLEIRVAPSRPLRFLTLRVVRVGERLTIEET